MRECRISGARYRGPDPNLFQSRISLQKFNQLASGRIEPGNAPIAERYRRRRAAHDDAPVVRGLAQRFFEVLDFVTNVISAASLCKRLPNRRLLVQRRHQLDGDVAGKLPAQKAHRNTLDRVIEWAGNQPVTEEAFV